MRRTRIATGTESTTLRGWPATRATASCRWCRRGSGSEKNFAIVREPAACLRLERQHQAVEERIDEQREHEQRRRQHQQRHAVETALSQNETQRYRSLIVSWRGALVESVVMRRLLRRPAPCRLGAEMERLARRHPLLGAEEQLGAILGERGAVEVAAAIFRRSPPWPRSGRPAVGADPPAGSRRSASPSPAAPPACPSSAAPAHADHGGAASRRSSRASAAGCDSP